MHSYIPFDASGCCDVIINKWIVVLPDGDLHYYKTISSYDILDNLCRFSFFLYLRTKIFKKFDILFC